MLLLRLCHLRDWHLITGVAVDVVLNRGLRNWAHSVTGDLTVDRRVVRVEHPLKLIINKYL